MEPMWISKVISSQRTFSFLVVSRKVENLIINLQVLKTQDILEKNIYGGSRMFWSWNIPRIQQCNQFTKIPLCVKDFLDTSN